MPMDQLKRQWLLWASELESIAQIGLTYCKDVFCHERYKRIREISADIISNHTQYSREEVIDLLEPDMGYKTPKLDVRGVVFKDNKILMVKEAATQDWALPGGWADVNESPSEAVVREVFEESGYKTSVIKMLALYDKQKHEHPDRFPHAYKCFFLCNIIGGEPKASFETCDVGFFEEDQLPELSLPRITPEQIHRLFLHHQHPNWPTDFD